MPTNEEDGFNSRVKEVKSPLHDIEEEKSMGIEVS